MANDQEHGLDPELVEPVAEFVFAAIKPHFSGTVADKPIPEDEIREALAQGSGYIKAMEGKTDYLVVTHRQGKVCVHYGHTRGQIQSARRFIWNWEDIYHLDGGAEVHLGLDGVSLLIQPQGEEKGALLDVTLLQLSKIDIEPFIKGLKQGGLQLASC